MDSASKKVLPRPARTASAELDAALVRRVVSEALAEDLGPGDVTTDSVVPEGARATARLIAKANGTLAGLPVFTRVFLLCDAGATVAPEVRDGDPVSRGQTLVRVEGNARAILHAERTALNFVQRLSGVATLTAEFVRLAAGRTRILDTRKTTPGLRALEKYAVVCGGGENHRFGLFDEAMLKDNHRDMVNSEPEALVAELRSRVGPRVRITAEARNDTEARSAIRGGADVVLLDNFTPAELAELLPGLRGHAQDLGRAVEFEASGGVDLTTIEAFAASGVDRVSVGALTHSAPALDLSLEVRAAS